MKIEIEISDYQQKLLELDMISISDWIMNFINEKVRNVERPIIIASTNFNPEKLTISEKEIILKDVPFTSALTREIESRIIK